MARVIKPLQRTVEQKMMFKKGKLRRQVQREFMSRMSSSLIGHLITLCVAMFYFGMYLHVYYLYFSIIPLGYGVWKRRGVFSEIILIRFWILNLTGYAQWSNVVDENLILGALPMLPDDIAHLTKKMGVNVVVSLVETFEYSITLAGKPAQPADWRRCDVLHHALPCPAFEIPSIEMLNKGAALLNTIISEGGSSRRVLCHCSTGQSRAASMVIAYMIKYKGMRTDKAHELLMHSCPSIFSKSSPTMSRVRAFEDTFRNLSNPSNS